jgi:hypothetical protein
MAGLSDCIRSKSRCTLSLPAFLLCLALLIQSLLTFTLASACYSTFDCSLFLPTLSYTAAYKGYDRVLILALSLEACALVVFVLAAQAYYRPMISAEEHYLMLGSGLLLCLVLPGGGVVDEVNTASGVPLEKIHYWLVVTALSLAGIWSDLSLQIERKLGNWVILRYMRTAWAAAGFSILQWTFADSIYRSSLLNSHLEALSEWIAVSLGVFAPFVYSLTLPKCHFWLQTS